jgi:hypothetical protein
MKNKTIKIYEGKVMRDVFGSWEDCSPGLYLDHEMIETIFWRYKGKKIRVTIEEVIEEE